MKSWFKKHSTNKKHEDSNTYWQLDNVYERNKESPYTFYKPSKAVTDKLKAGDLVKLVFFSDSDTAGYKGERMWVEITDRNKENFVGKLDNEPYHLKGLKLGQILHFGTEHICDTEYEDDEVAKMDYYFNTLVTVSNDVLERNEFNFLLKDKPNEPNDSGWVIFSGYEEDEFTSNPKNNFQIVALGVALNVDDSILAFINESPLCAYERNEFGKFDRIHDYDWETYLSE
ncbi:immunity protein Imm33 domain-containing protein [Priestia megaterium]|uniref:immunity protein Imm33 domain-containing protein n=1 Tax=Priestia megaterium TaxID=1404 RepID=UPI00301BD8A4